MNMELVENAIERVRNAFSLNERVISGHSGGKDSAVIHKIMELAEVEPYQILHSPKPLWDDSISEEQMKTAMDPDTLFYLYEYVCSKKPILILPSSMTVDWLKNNKVTCQIDGSRISEFNREDKSSTFISNGVNVSRSEMTEYVENGIFGLNMCYPIFDWTDDDVFDFIEYSGMSISYEYVKNGEIESYYDRKTKRNTSTAC